MTDRPPFRSNALFGRGEVVSLNACVGNNGGPYDFFDYASGYLDSARRMIDQLSSGSGLVDLLVYPICFNFRHGVELIVKGLIPIVGTIEGRELRYRANHSLKDNWSLLKSSLLRSALRIASEDVTYIDQVIEHFDEVDPNGQIFRYPESIKGDQHLKEWSLINVLVVGDALSRVTDILTRWHYENEEALAYVREHGGGPL